MTAVSSPYFMTNEQHIRVQQWAREAQAKVQAEMILPYTRRELEAMIRGCNQMKGYVLTQEYEDLHQDWLDNYSACTCHLGHPPCSSCTHEGHPICLENNEEAWHIDILTWIPVEGIL